MKATIFATLLSQVLLVTASVAHSFIPGIAFDPNTVRVEVGGSEDQSYVQEDLARAWAQDKTVVLSHPEHTQISLRIKQIGRKQESWVQGGALPVSSNDSFCDATVNSFSGYIDMIDGKSLFFYFFESRNDPAKDPLVAWTNGGPGASSAVGLFQELGPCRVKTDDTGKSAPGPMSNATEFNPHSWNSVANMIFVDQPVDVGFSYSRYGVSSFTSDEAAVDMLSFVQLFLTAFPKHRDSDLYWSGESYAGRYLPVFASTIVDHNKAVRAKAERSGHKADPSKEINLKGVLIGNGWTSAARQLPLYYDFLCTKRGGLEPIVGISACRRMSVWKNKCTPWLLESCVTNWNADECGSAQAQCTNELMSAFVATGRNVYNAMDLCPRSKDGDCYAIDGAISEFLNREDVRAYLGAAPASEIGKYSEENVKVFKGFAETLDESVDSVGYVAGLLENGIRVHAYAGTYDFICNLYGFRSIFWEMEWAGKEKLVASKEKDWFVNGTRAGDSVTVENFTWSTVAEAGHLVPYDQPERALHLFQSWLAGHSP
ncbi:hypothetical protein A4X06_0g7644 [Tilletia controversa]|uniref:carboxypeptidase C n=1 Tax=Tilletia controversa TaxID=13291 RepID=A0A8X7MMH8_9BASI|nr:hypothetical protein A4X06_0g7644 [Tilletia controversa]